MDESDTFKKRSRSAYEGEGDPTAAAGEHRAAMGQGADQASPGAGPSDNPSADSSDSSAEAEQPWEPFAAACAAHDVAHPLPTPCLYPGHDVAHPPYSADGSTEQPSEEDIRLAIAQMYACLNFSPGCLVVALIYIERLRRCTGAEVLARTWQPTLLITTIVAQKVCTRL